MSAAPHIFTLTGNLLAERTLEFDGGWTAGRTQRARRESFQVGGKGINVAKMLTRLGVPNTALCFSGGATGEECEAWLRARGFAFNAFRTARPTRSGTVVRDAIGMQRETTLLGPDVAPDPAAIRACAEFLEAQRAGQVLALCGSFPGWAEASCDVLRDALEHWRTRGTLVVDSYGPPLAWAAERPVALIKINADELRSLGVADPAKLPASVERWVVTDGPRPVWFRDRGEPPAAATPPAVKEWSATGSGDVLLACVLDALFRRHLRLEQAIAFALPYAAANAAHPAIAEFPLPDSARIA